MIGFVAKSALSGQIVVVSSVHKLNIIISKMIRKQWPSVGWKFRYQLPSKDIRTCPGERLRQLPQGRDHNAQVFQDHNRNGTIRT
jgi:hypothetical protein